MVQTQMMPPRGREIGLTAKDALLQGDSKMPASTSARALQALKELFRTYSGSACDSQQRTLWLKDLGQRKPGTRSTDRAEKLHKSLATTFYSNDKASEYTAQEVYDFLCQGSYNLQHLLSQQYPSQRTILHVILDPHTYEQKISIKSFDRLKPLLEFLLWIQPDLPMVSEMIGQTPLFQVLKPAPQPKPAEGRAEAGADDSDDDGVAYFLDDKVKTEILNFFCADKPNGLGSEHAVKSLVSLASLPESDASSARHAIHGAIESDLPLSESVLAKLARIKKSYKLGGSDTEMPCLEIPDRRGRSCLHIALTAPFNNLPTKIEWARQLAKLQPGLLKKTYELQAGKDSKGKAIYLSLTPLQYLAKQREETTSKKGGTDKTSLQKANDLEKDLDSITEDLKRRCLEEFDVETCKSIMYTRTNQREIYLPFDDEIISIELLESQFKHYHLDTSLKSLTIFNTNRVQWDERDERSKKIHDEIAWRCSGNTDLYLVFHWLKKITNVKKIFEVVVDDLPADGTKPHSDKAIIKCLEGLGVETWDWRRMDIPVHVIAKSAGQQVKMLNLYCSGLRAVLQSWSGTDGLVTLEHLEKVHVEIHQGLESPEDVKIFADEFVADLKKQHMDMYKNEIEKQEKKPLEVEWEPPTSESNQNHDPGAKHGTDHEVNLEEQVEGRNNHREAKADNSHRQDWIRCMDDFANVMLEIEKSPCRPIKVALIDDGVKTSYEYLNDQVHCGKSEWGLTSPKPRGGDSEKKRRFRNYASTYTSSYTGHGTVMAYYICRMCPAVELCIAKLEPQSPSKNNVAAGTHSQQIAFTIESVTEAIKWAVGENVDIITMSWAIDEFSPRNDRDKRIDKLRDAINMAAEANILMFCANPDKGADYKINKTFPKSLVSENTLFVIGAATKDGGNPWHRIASGDKSCNFLLPGTELAVRVQSSVKRKATKKTVEDGKPPVEWENHSGSSLSCALAAGLAAMILHCALASGIQADDPRWTWLKTRNGMNEALRNIDPDGRGDGNNTWLPVSRTFGVTAKLAKWAPESEIRKSLYKDVVAKLLVKAPSSDDSDPVPGRLKRQATVRESE